MATIRKIQEGMTATQVAEAVDDNFYSVIADVQSVQTDVSNEQARAEAAEAEALSIAEAARNTANAMGDRVTTLETGLTTETSRAKAAEEANTAAIIAEKARAEEVEKSLGDDIMSCSADISIMQGKIEDLQAKDAAQDSVIATETSRAKAAEEANATAIANEQARAEAAEEANAAAVITERDRAIAEEEGLLEQIGLTQTALGDEQNRAEGVEAGLRGDIDAEVTRAKAAEEEAVQMINEETTRAKAAEEAVKSELTAVNDGQTEVLKRLDAGVDPLTVRLTGGGGLYKRGTTAEVTVTWTAKKSGETVAASLLTTVVNGGEVAKGSTSITETVEADKTWHVECGYTYELWAGVENTVSGSASTSVMFVGAMFVGAMAEAEAANVEKNLLTEQSVRRNPAGSYSVTATETSYLWIVVPSEMTVSKVTLNGFDNPMEGVVEIDGYKYYRSSNQMVAGTYTFVVSGTGI